jgi:hypothetical protein
MEHFRVEAQLGPSAAAEYDRKMDVEWTRNWRHARESGAARAASNSSLWRIARVLKKAILRASSEVRAQVLENTSTMQVANGFDAKARLADRKSVV